MTRVHEYSVAALPASVVSSKSFPHSEASGVDAPTCLPIGNGSNHLPDQSSVTGKPQVQSAPAFAGQSHHERSSGSCRIAIKAMHRPGLYQWQDCLLCGIRFS
ncbi:hypothetical protein R77555_04342 [Ralstonia mannitolilytica]|nr:hypothetical protein R77555_04342 [Ralstonia mannitolilytica]